MAPRAEIVQLLAGKDDTVADRRCRWWQSDRGCMRGGVGVGQMTRRLGEMPHVRRQ